MRIAIFTDTFLPQINGVVRSIVTTANQLVERGHAVAVFTMDIGKLANGDATSDLDARIPVYPFPSVAFPGFAHIQARVPSLVGPLKAVRRFQADVIHLHTIFTMGLESVWVAKLLKCPLVGSHHGFLAEYLDNFGLDFALAKDLTRRYLAFYYNRCNAVITPAEALKNELLGHKMRRPVHVVSNPISLKCFSASASKPELKGRFGMTRPIAVHVGRLVRQKSVDVLLEAFHHLRQNGVDAHLLVIGDGQDRFRLEALGRALGLSDHVTWTGILTGRDLVDHIAAADVFASASTTEVQPLVFLEAMALGLPAVGVNAGGVPEILRQGGNGFVVEPANPRALADSLGALLVDDERRKRMGETARESVRAYDAERVVEDFERVYTSVISTCPPSRPSAGL
ncbi:MAG: glycosyltransferase [Gammaproteobacteria bacterium]